MVAVEVAVAEPALLGECPLWSAAEGVLYWIDIDGRAVRRFDPSSGVDGRCAVPARPGSIALTTVPGTLLMATEHELVWLDWVSGAITPWLELETPGVGVRLNDGRTDPVGRFYVGSMFQDTSVGRRDGSLHRVDPDGTTRVIRRGVGVSNGLGFDVDRGAMYFADSPTGRVWRWHYDAATAEMSDEQLFFDYEASDTTPGKPDGACVDSEGCYWSASVHGWAVLRITPDGRVDRRIELPVSKPSMPAFGGPGLDSLFVTSISDGPGQATESGEQGVAQGALLVIDVSSLGVTGCVDPPFAGDPPGSE